MPRARAVKRSDRTLSSASVQVNPDEGVERGVERWKKKRERERRSDWRLNFRFYVPRQGSAGPPDPGRGSAQTTFPQSQPTAHYDSDLRPALPCSICEQSRWPEGDQVDSDGVRLTEWPINLDSSLAPWIFLLIDRGKKIFVKILFLTKQNYTRKEIQKNWVLRNHKKLPLNKKRYITINSSLGHPKWSIISTKFSCQNSLYI